MYILLHLSLSLSICPCQYLLIYTRHIVHIWYAFIFQTTSALTTLWPWPNDPTVTCLSRYAPIFTEITWSLWETLKRGVSFQWDDPQIMAFQQVKDRLVASPVSVWKCSVQSIHSVDAVYNVALFFIKSINVINAVSQHVEIIQRNSQFVVESWVIHYGPVISGHLLKIVVNKKKRGLCNLLSHTVLTPSKHELKVTSLSVSNLLVKLCGTADFHAKKLQVWILGR